MIVSCVTISKGMRGQFVCSRDVFGFFAIARGEYFDDNLIQKEMLYVIALKKGRKLMHFSFQLIS